MRIVHWAFELMVLTGTALFGVAVWVGIARFRRRPLAQNPWLLTALVAAGPLGFIAIETGWVVTEVGRQPWIIYGVLRTRDAVSTMPGQVVPFVVFTLLYLFLAVMVALLLHRQFRDAPGSSAKSEPASLDV